MKKIEDLLKSLAESIKAMQAQMLTLSEGKVSGSNRTYLLASSQYINAISSNTPAAKNKKTMSEVNNMESKEEEDDTDFPETEGKLYQLSEEAGMLIKMAFKSKDNFTIKVRACKFGLLDSRWLRFPKLEVRSSCHHYKLMLVLVG